MRIQSVVRLRCKFFPWIWCKNGSIELERHLMGKFLFFCFRWVEWKNHANCGGFKYWELQCRWEMGILVFKGLYFWRTVLGLIALWERNMYKWSQKLDSRAFVGEVKFTKGVRSFSRYGVRSIRYTIRVYTTGKATYAIFSTVRIFAMRYIILARNRINFGIKWVDLVCGGKAAYMV